MKIKKTYTRSGVGLFVGLLSFQALSSCANTGRQLGMMRCFQSEEEKKINQVHKVNKKNLEDAHKLNVCSGKCPSNGLPCPYCTSLWYKWRKTVLLGTATAVTLSGLGASCYYLWPLASSPMDNTMMNITTPGNATADLESTLASVQNIVNTTASAVGSTIQGLATTAAPVVMATLNTAGLLAVLRSNNNGSATTMTPSNLDTTTMPAECKSLNIADSDMLTQENIDYLKEYGFSSESMECLFKAGLHTDARDTDQRTLLMEVINRVEALPNAFKSVVLLVEERGANVNAEDDRGNTPLGYAVYRGRTAQGTAKARARAIINFLEKKGANPCKKNIDGKPLHVDIVSFNNQELSEKSKQCS